MATARVFRSGNSQAVRLPKQFRVRGDEVEIFRRGDEIVLRERRVTGSSLMDLLDALPEAMFAEDRHDPPPQQRDGL